MATKARQQYFADEISLQKDSREFSLEDNIKQKIDSVEAGAQVNTIETVKVNGTALTPDANKAVNVEVPDVIDNLYTVAADDALSAKQGKILYDYIQNLQTIGRFLSNWDSAAGLPITNPSESPYLYKAGDYYRVSNVAVSPASNYKPDGSSYTIGVASTTVETLSVAVSDLYLYDGTDWILLSNSGSAIAIDSSLSTISTNPVENRVITNALNGKHPGAISNVAPSNPVEGMLWYDTVNDELKTYNGTAWQTEGTKMVVLQYGVSTWQDFIDAYNENAVVYCRVSSGSSGYRMAFMAYTAGQGTPTEVEFQYYRSRSSHSQSSTQLDEVYVYKLTNAGVWTTTQRDTGAEMIAGTGIGITFNSSGATIYNSGVTSVNGNTGTVTVEEVPSGGTEGQVLTQTNNGPAWQNPTGGAEIEYKTQAEYDALPSSKLTDNKHYFIYSTSGGGGWQPGVNTIVYYPLDSTNTVNDLSGNLYNLTNAGGVTFGTNAGVDCAYFNYSYLYYSSLSAIPQGNAVRTVSYYVYCQQTDKQHFQRGNSGSDYAFGTFMGGNNHLYISTYLGLGLEGTVDMTNAWHYVTITHDGATLKLYIDGQLDNSANGTLNTTGTDFYIGHCTWVSWNFDKYISNFIVEDKARTAQEISDYFDQTKANYGIS